MFTNFTQERDLQRQLRRLNPGSHSPSETAVQKLLESPRALSVTELDSPALMALINASPNETFSSDTSFVLRQYKDPNANRQHEDETERITSGVDSELQEDNSTDSAHNSPCHLREYTTPGDIAGAEALPRTPPDFLNGPLSAVSPQPPYEDFSFAAKDLSTPSESIWNLWDVFSGGLGELFPGQPEEYARIWKEAE